MPTEFRIMLFLIVAIIATILSPIKAINPRKLDETTNPAAGGSPNDAVKCGSCYSSPPPPVPTPSPPPPTPSPPPPTPSPPPPTPSPPPPSPTPSPTPPSPTPSPPPPSPPPPKPPSPDVIYVAVPPGNLYPIVESSISAAYDDKRFAVAPASMVVFVFLGMLAFW